MTIEAVTYIDDLDDTYPAGTDAKSEGDNHIRNIKTALVATFPSIDAPVTATEDELNILDGATLSTAELNILDGVTASAGELNYLDVTTLGTVQASKAVTANGSVVTTFPSGSTLTIGTGATINLSGTTNVGGVAVTASAAELNILDGATLSTAELNILDGVTATADELNYADVATLGTVQASKAVTAGAGGGVTFPAGTELTINGTLTIGNDWYINATQVTASAAELNVLDGVTATYAELNHLSGATENVQDRLDNLKKFVIVLSIDAGSNDSWTVLQKASFAFDIDSCTHITDSGTITAAVKIDGTNVTGLGALSVDDSETTTTATAANSVAVGETVSVTFSSNSSAVGIVLQLACTRT